MLRFDEIFLKSLENKPRVWYNSHKTANRKEMNIMEKRNLTPAAKYGYAAISVLIIIIGLILIFSPESAAGLVCTIFGVTMLVWGICKVVSFFVVREVAFPIDVVIGVIMAIIGAVSLFHPAGFISLIFRAAGIGILIDGIGKIVRAANLKKAEYPWKISMITSVVTTLAGLLLLANPFGAVKFVISFSGIAVLIAGISNLVSAINAIKSMPTEVYVDGDSRDDESGRIDRF